MNQEATHRQIAIVLEELSQEVEALGASLCLDPDIVVRHMTTLQAIDMIGQKQRSLASLLTADCPAASIEKIAIDALRERLRLFG
ncbi:MULTISPECIES: hypothetical protein [unclassified Novosphingobium]|jgi:hypothetical protein|uniref:hypothetical protein n=1 Tax=unclassified Novosphingobium TaxID=2644732 RepID=UPI00061C4892|nr:MULTISPECIES: hypothetical protein [unclassified Novosphingobium]ODU70175.1 MAG: hypothetical protein ABT11_08920 [Novosphingobium sp. SCN 66-18]MBF5091437.1 hypothetical protein [Novosphingobium sp. NBM11]QCI93205.1 hypothetical protein FA702_06310 [Novosphingobium sp. EMRT-2]RQW43976.1 hypothetical protein EH199_10880 [Novosphingobium sp. LASN5T]GAO55238.1 hypothetical protein NMD1_02348 [Novosphingobium sp. MD-1]